MADPQSLSREERLERYFQVAEEEGLWFSRAALTAYLPYLFENTELEGRRVLDIGGGSGVFTFYAASMGANEVLCLEPEEAGSTDDARFLFDRAHARLSFPAQVGYLDTPFQEFTTEGRRFDVILLHNSVNHLDEEACIRLRESEEARKVYQGLFQKIGDCAAPGSRLIITDCSRHNIFALLGVGNPFAPTIEWHKHQPPEVWARTLAGAGFHRPEVRWTPFIDKQKSGRRWPAGRIISFFHWSHFCLTMEKGADPCRV